MVRINLEGTFVNLLRLSSSPGSSLQYAPKFVTFWPVLLAEKFARESHVYRFVNEKTMRRHILALFFG